MNFLAHAFLAGDDPALRVGGVVGDWIKGPLPGILSPDLARGVALHRAIDSFAETHPAFCEIYKGEFKLDKLYIHPDVQRKGVGGQLIAHVAARAKKLGYPCVILAVNKRNEKAIGSYRKYGFEVRETIVDDIGRGYVMDDYIMEKKL